MGKTIAEKILSSHADADAVAGEQVVARIDSMMSHDAFRFVGKFLKDAGIRRLWDPSRLVIILDHGVPAPDEATAEYMQAIRRTAADYGVLDENFYDANGGISHQVMCERGYALPGELTIGTDSHSTMYGALNCGGVAVGFSEGAYAAATGRLWFQVPDTLRVELEGSLSPGVTAKDIILSLLGAHGTSFAQYKAIEYAGPGVADLTVESRMTIANMSAELGAKFAFFPIDDVARSYLEAAGPKRPFEPVNADADASYLMRHTLDLSQLEPLVACPYRPDNVKPVREVDARVTQAYLGSCTNARIEDLRAAANVLRGKKVAKGTRLLVSPASQRVYLEAIREGLLEVFVEAGGMVLNPGCGACFGKHLGLLAADDVCISSTNRNFRGRMGSAEAQVYLGSPVTVAASALAGRIVDPRETVDG